MKKLKKNHCIKKTSMANLNDGGQPAGLNPCYHP